MRNLIPKVDESNVIVGETTITEAKEQGWPRRVARVFILETDGESVLLQKRSMSVPAAPGTWDMCGGHVDLGESYVEAGAREVSEELGVEVLLNPISEPFRDDMTFAVVCVVTVPGDTVFTLLPDEVSEVKWVTYSELDALTTDPNSEITNWLRTSWLLFRDKLKT